MKNWIITIASVLVICLLLGVLTYAEFGSFNFIRVGLALTETMDGTGIRQIADSPERVWLVGIRDGLDGFRAYLEQEGWTLRMDEQMGAQIPVEKDGKWDYVYWSANGMYHKFTWQTAGDPARGTAPTEPVELYDLESVTASAYFYLDGTVIVNIATAPAFAYPASHDGWKLECHTDGSFTTEDGTICHRLYWESDVNWSVPMEEGFCVPGTDTAEFLTESLAELGLNSLEINDFLITWLPKMESNAYNLITFHTVQVADISPAPETLIRVLMVCKPLTEPMDIAPQTLTPTQRTGSTAVLLGGAEVTE